MELKQRHTEAECEMLFYVTFYSTLIYLLSPELSIGGFNPLYKISQMNYRTTGLDDLVDCEFEPLK